MVNRQCTFPLKMFKSVVSIVEDKIFGVGLFEVSMSKDDRSEDSGF